MLSQGPWLSLDALRATYGDPKGRIARIGGVEKIRLPDVGHYPPAEIADRSAKLVTAYIEVAVPADARHKR